MKHIIIYNGLFLNDELEVKEKETLKGKWQNLKN